MKCKACGKITGCNGAWYWNESCVCQRCHEELTALAKSPEGDPKLEAAFLAASLIGCFFIPVFATFIWWMVQ
jgi:hypothetical protein